MAVRGKVGHCRRLVAEIATNWQGLLMLPHAQMRDREGCGAAHMLPVG
jgi:hypothetical protein